MKCFRSTIQDRIRLAFVSVVSIAGNVWPHAATSYRTGHLGSAVPTNRNLRTASTTFATLTKAAVLVVLVCVALTAVNEVVAYPDSHPQFPVDRWDPDWTERDMWEPGAMEPGQRQRITRHWTFMNEGVPAEYRGKVNPLASSSSVLQAGGRLYQQQCSVCHGAQGMGDGEAANSVNPSPALLAYMVKRPQSVDEYLMWSISEGGKAFGTPMPDFKGTLSELDIWKIITFMRAGFPPLEEN